MKKLVLYGDSNTYGYDPRGTLGGRYPAEVRWATIVKTALSDSYEVIEEGMNGRMLPGVEHGYFVELLSGLASEDTVVMMLGTNDVLLSYHPDVTQIADKMERILSYVKKNFVGKFIMIAPPLIEAVEPDLKVYRDASIEMNQCFMKLAKRYEIPAYDASEWKIIMGYDGVHFTVEGHKRFAEKMIDVLNEECIRGRTCTNGE